MSADCCGPAHDAAVESLTEAIKDFASDERMIYELPAVIKSALFELCSEHRSRAQQIADVHNLIFKEGI